jgi:type II secretory ATPase GspE/PulE/Tfp pilus assembly ATPase PilB-like protein
VNIGSIYQTYAEAETIKLLDGAVYISVNADEKVIFIDKKRVRESTSEDKEAIRSLVDKSPGALIKPIVWNDAAWKAAIKFYYEKNSQFLISELGDGYLEVQSQLPEQLKRHFILVKVCNAEDDQAFFLCVDRDVEKKQEFKQITEAISRIHVKTKIAFVSSRDLGLIREAAVVNGSNSGKIKSHALDLLYGILRKGIEMGASDIHLIARDPSRNEGEGSYYRYRVKKSLLPKNDISYDDLLKIVRSAWRTEGSTNTEEYKISASLARTVEARINISGGDRKYQFRFQQSPLDGGFKVVLRIIDSDIKTLEGLTFEKMGYLDSQIPMIIETLIAQVGSVVFGGVTNSGKTTSVSRLLIESVNRNPDASVDSIEDPIEYKLPMINQHPLSIANIDTSGLTENEARTHAAVQKLNDLLRMDPDTINVGEIRDAVFAKVFSDTVRTGHKAFSTTHTSSAFGVYTRFNGLGIEMETLSEPDFINGIVWQALVPVVCPSCSTAFYETGLGSEAKDKALTKLIPDCENVRVASKSGCEECHYTGRKGLTACAEIVVPDAKLNEFIRKNEIYEASEYWKKEMLPKGTEFEFKGITFRDVVIWKIYKGLICPFVAESQLGKTLEKISLEESDRTNEILFTDTAYRKMKLA